MIHSALLYTAALAIASAVAGGTGDLLPRQYSDACQEIAQSISSASQVYDTLSFNYDEDISHWASSSTQLAACSFEPGTAKDTSIALRILGQSRTPFAVKGGGHTANIGFSSTLGVQISMTRFSEVSYDPSSQTATIGAGLIWDDVYAALEPYGVNVVGGRVTGVGVAGFILGGGGYSWLSNQYGLTIDTVQAFELVQPNGTVTNVTETSSPDLFFALKGGQNNFGIVTRFTLRTFPQTQIWGGLITYTGGVLEQVTQATANFVATNNDPKGVIITSYNYFLTQPLVFQFIFYDAPSPPKGMFDAFLDIPALANDVSTRSYLSFVRTSPVNLTDGTRVAFNTVSVPSYSLNILESIFNETLFWGENFLLEPEFLISYSVEPLLPTFLDKNKTPSAYPYSRSTGYTPLAILYSWLLPTSDEAFQEAVRTTASTLKAHVIESQADAAGLALYPNYAIYDTPLTDLYGDNLSRLQAIKAAVDPDNVMGLAGGFKLQA